MNSLDLIRNNILMNRRDKNNRRIKYFLFLALGFVMLSSAFAGPNERVARYSMQMLGANIGEFSVTQTSENGNINIEAITDVKINLLFPYRIKYVQNTIYNHGILQSSHVETYKNGKLNSNMWLKLQNNSYLLVTDGDTAIVSESITYSGSMVYFNEPKGIKKIYKERSAEMKQINAAGEHVYIIKDEKGREINKYYYEDGILQHAEMRHTLGTIELILETKN